MTRKQAVKVTTLGRFSICVGGTPLAFGRKTPMRPLALLKFLAACGGGEVAESTVAEALWPGKGARALGSLAINVHRLRRLLGSDAMLIRREGHIAIDARHVWCDAASFERMLDLAAGAARPQHRLRYTERALALYRGDFLPGDAHEPWISTARARLRQRYLEACALLQRPELESVSDL